MPGKRPRNRPGVSIVLVVLFAAFGVFSLLYWGPPNRDFLDKQEEFREGLGTDDAKLAEAKNSRSAQTTLNYVTAVQTGVCARAIDLTWWMQERLQFAAQNSPDGVSTARQELCDSITARERGGNRLSSEGVEDQYVFTPMADVEVVAVEAGRQDLAKASKERVWLEVSYPIPTQALHDEKGAPIKSLRVGVSLSNDGFILKAGTVGNLEIDFDSISYSW